jgi:hypothetical protein
VTPGLLTVGLAGHPGPRQHELDAERQSDVLPSSDQGYWSSIRTCVGDVDLGCIPCLTLGDEYDARSCQRRIRHRGRER